MKKLAFVAILGIVSASSCKKDYSCTCTTTVSGGGVNVSTTTVHIIPGATQQQASAVCVGYEVYTQGNSQITTCKLK